MKHVRWIPAALLALAFVAALVALFHAVQAPPEPEWGGRKLTSWLRDTPPSPARSRWSTSPTSPEELNEWLRGQKAALQGMSPECFPYMLMMMRARDARWEFHLAALLSKQKFIKFRLRPRPSYLGRWEAARGFALLGTNAAPAVPGLRRLLRDADTSSQASYALIRIPTAEATRAVEQALEGKDPALRRTLYTHLGAAGSDASRFVPALLRVLNDPDPFVREHCAYALGEMKQKLELVVPGLAARLTDRVPDVSRAAAVALAKFGDQAQQAVPALVRLAEKNDPTTYAAAVRALGKIDTKAAEPFPSTWTPATTIATSNSHGRSE